MQAPAPNRGADPLGCLVADSRVEPIKLRTRARLRWSCPERVAQKIKRSMRIVPAPVAILAVHDAGLVRVQPQLACSHSGLQGLPEVFGLLLRGALTYHIISVTLKRNGWMP